MVIKELASFGLLKMKTKNTGFIKYHMVKELWDAVL